MGTAFGSLLGIVGTRPERVADGFAGPLHEGLSEELWALEPPVDPTCVPAALSDGGNARILLEVSGRSITLALFAKGHQETRGEDGTGTWERLKEREVGMRRGQLCNGMVEVLDRLQRSAELGYESPDEAHLGRNDARIRRQRCGGFDGLKALSNNARLYMVLAQEALESGAAGQVGRFEGRPWGEEIAEDDRVFVREP